MTDAADVLAIDSLRPSLQPAALGRQRIEPNLVADHHEKVDVLWVGSVGANRAQQTDLKHTINPDDRTYEVETCRKEFLSTTGFLVSSHASTPGCCCRHRRCAVNRGSPPSGQRL
jgi:hypothetical protein